MKIIGTFGLAVVTSFTLMQSAEARGGGGHFGGGGGHFGGGGAHFSGGAHYSGGGARYSGGGARYSGARNFSGGGRYYAGPRVSSMPNNHSNVSSNPRFSPGTAGLRNPTYVSGARQFAGNRTAAYNSRTFSRSNANLGPGNRTLQNRSGLGNQGRVIGSHNASTWHRNWSHGHDHNWHGHRCHFNTGFWFVYDPFPYWYPWDYYGYGYYPYDGYYDGGYYDQGAQPQEQVYTAPADSNQSDYAVDSQVSNVQSALAREGYYDGAIDGKLGPGTRNALRRYQRDRGLEVTGGITHGVTQALRLR